MKINKYVNLPITLKYTSGLKRYKTKYEPGRFGKGKLKDTRKAPWDEGNFLAQFFDFDNRTWSEPKPYEFNKDEWNTEFLWGAEIEGKDVYLELTYKQNENLMSAIQGQEAPVTVIPRADDKTFTFELKRKETVTDISPEDLPY